MVYEHFSKCFILEDPSSGFLKLFQVIIITHGDILKSVALMLGTIKLLAMAKDTNGLRFIIVSKLFFRLINHSIVLQLQGSFQEHLSLYQFGISTPGACEAISFDIRTFLNLHLNWAMMQINIEKVFNKISRTTIFRELCDAKGPLANIIPFTNLFYGVHSFFYY